MATDLRTIVGAVEAVLTGTIRGLERSPMILDPRATPQTRLHKVFSVDAQTVNTGKYRDAPDRRMRLDSELTVRLVHRLHPQDQQATQQEAWADEQTAIQAVLTDTRAPFGEVRRLYRSTRRTLDPTREWLFTDVVFSLEYDLSMTATNAA